MFNPSSSPMLSHLAGSVLILRKVHTWAGPPGYRGRSRQIPAFETTPSSRSTRTDPSARSDQRTKSAKSATSEKALHPSEPIHIARVHVVPDFSPSRLAECSRVAGRGDRRKSVAD